MTFFPQIIQGPISFYDQLAHQLYEPHDYDFVRLKKGAELMLWGYFKKLVIADRIVGLLNVILEKYAEYNGNYYGTPATPARRHYENGETVIFVIEVVGAGKIKARFPEAVTVFLTPPSFEELRARLVGRNTESAEEVEKRLEIARREIEIGCRDYDYVVENDVLEDTVAKIKRIIEFEKEKRNAVSDPE